MHGDLPFRQSGQQTMEQHLLQNTVHFLFLAKPRYKMGDRRVPRHHTNMFKNWERKYARLLREFQSHPRVSSYPPPVPSRESCLNLSGRGRKADTAPIEGTLCLFIIDERRLVHIVTIDTIVETATELKSTVMGTKSREVLVPAIHASESSDHPTNLSFLTQDSGRVGTVMAPFRGARDGDSK
ncbi:hypothetical protein GQ600_21563 [Phytophthora cactorum]|nr:hypothetical protein GQ600_21563 [Phytophthora cactorum]